MVSLDGEFIPFFMVILSSIGLQPFWDLGPNEDIFLSCLDHLLEFTDSAKLPLEVVSENNLSVVFKLAKGSKFADLITGFLTSSGASSPLCKKWL